MHNKYRRIKRHENSRLQRHQIILMMLLGTTALLIICVTLATVNSFILEWLSFPIKILCCFILVLTVLSVISLKIREQVSTLVIPKMTVHSIKVAKPIQRLFNDKQITDVLKLSNLTRYGDEMPTIYVWISDDLLNGYVAIENIANYDRANRLNFEQKVSGVLSGKYQRYAVVNSELSAGDSFIIFYFEDTLTSQQLIIESDSDLIKHINDDKHAITLSKDLTWYSNIVPHFSIIARTRAGKSMLAGQYMAKIMLLQGWAVEYNSAKYDKYVKSFNGQSDPIKIVERAEYWCSVMDKRLVEINESGKDKYSDLNDMPDIALFFDELGNLNASLEALDKQDRTLKITSRWTTAINRLSATGGSAGIHIIAISQFATKEGFLPSLARVNCSDAVIMLGGAADSATERQYLMSGFADMPKRNYGQGQGVARILGSGKKWEIPHLYESPWFKAN